VHTSILCSWAEKLCRAPATCCAPRLLEHQAARAVEPTVQSRRQHPLPATLLRSRALYAHLRMIMFLTERSSLHEGAAACTARKRAKFKRAYTLAGFHIR
jgi:hypothetical protein